MSKLASAGRHAEPTTARPIADAALRDQVTQLLAGWELEDPNPEHYSRVLQHLASQAADADGRSFATTLTDAPPTRSASSRSHSRSAATDRPVERAVDQLVATGNVGAHPRAPQVAAAGQRQRRRRARRAARPPVQPRRARQSRADGRGEPRRPPPVHVGGRLPGASRCPRQLGESRHSPEADRSSRARRARHRPVHRGAARGRSLVRPAQHAAPDGAVGTDSGGLFRHALDDAPGRSGALRGASPAADHRARARSCDPYRDRRRGSANRAARPGLAAAGLSADLHRQGRGDRAAT